MAIAVPAVIKEARRRQRLRRLGIGVAALAAAVAVASVWASGGFRGGSGSASQGAFFRGNEGWTLTYPRVFHRRSFVVDFFHYSEQGVSIGNFSPLPAADFLKNRPGGPLIGVPPTGVLFQLYTVDGMGGGPLGKEVHSPLTLHDFGGFAVDPAHVRQAGPGSFSFQTNGYLFHAVAVAGRDASPVDLRALARTVSSVHFPVLQTGEFTGSGSYVLKLASAYPVGSVTRVDPPAMLNGHRTGLGSFYLLHDRRGFRAIGWQPSFYPPKYRVPCDVQADPARLQFYCPSGGRWDSLGRTLVNPPGAKQIESLALYATHISQGHVLVSEFAQTFAGCLRRVLLCR